MKPVAQGFVPESSEEVSGSPHASGFESTVQGLYEAVKQLWPDDPVRLDKPENERRDMAGEHSLFAANPTRNNQDEYDARKN